MSRNELETLVEINILNVCFFLQKILAPFRERMEKFNCHQENI